MPRKRTALLALIIVAAAGVGAAVWLIGFSRWHALPTGGPATVQHEPVRLATISVPRDLSSLAWSPDGSYVAAGTTEWVDGHPNQVLMLDVGKQAIVATLQVGGPVELMAFSPDGKWLAVSLGGSYPVNSVTPGAAELVVFDVPAFTVKFSTRSKVPVATPGNSRSRRFVDLAWAPESNALHAVEADGEPTLGTDPEFHCWDVVTFVERPPIKFDPAKNIHCNALAVSPDGLTLAVAGQNESNQLGIRLFSLDKGTPIASIVTDKPGGDALGFTTDGKAIGVLAGIELSWWDVDTGRPTNPASPQFAVLPPRQRYASSDRSKSVSVYTPLRDFGDITPRQWQDAEKYGTFVTLTLTTPVNTSNNNQAPNKKSLRWCVGHGHAAVALSPDGTKLAGTVELTNGLGVAIWQVPK
jgi:WD40 repeat protein